MKINKKGFMLAETLIVTTFAAGVLIYIYIQFTNLNSNYNESFKYNTVEDLYALKDIVDYIKDNDEIFNNIKNVVGQTGYIEITSCDSSIVVEQKYCQNLFNALNIERIYVTENYINENFKVLNYDEFNNFISKIKPSGVEEYRLIASFNDNTFATVRFGETNE